MFARAAGVSGPQAGSESPDDFCAWRNPGRLAAHQQDSPARHPQRRDLYTELPAWLFLGLQWLYVSLEITASLPVLLSPIFSLEFHSRVRFVSPKRTSSLSLDQISWCRQGCRQEIPSWNFHSFLLHTTGVVRDCYKIATEHFSSLTDVASGFLLSSFSLSARG